MYFIVIAPASGRFSWPMFSLLFAFLTLGTIQVAAQAKFGEMIWIDYRNSLGGPVVWFQSHYSNRFNVLEFCAFITANFLADAVLVRLYGTFCHL